MYSRERHSCTLNSAHAEELNPVLNVPESGLLKIHHRMVLKNLWLSRG